MLGLFGSDARSSYTYSGNVGSVSQGYLHTSSPYISAQSGIFILEKLSIFIIYDIHLSYRQQCHTRPCASYCDTRWSTHRHQVRTGYDIIQHEYGTTCWYILPAFFHGFGMFSSCSGSCVSILPAWHRVKYEHVVYLVYDKHISIGHCWCRTLPARWYVWCMTYCMNMCTLGMFAVMSNLWNQARIQDCFTRIDMVDWLKRETS